MSTETTATIRKSTLIISILSVIPHIFCCGIPAVMAIISLGTTTGLAMVLATNPLYQMVDNYHEILITIAIAAVVFSGILNLIAWRLDCRTAEGSACHHDDCRPKKSKSFKIFLLSLLLLALDLSWFATEKFALGLHDHTHSHEHGHEEHHEPIYITH